MTKRALSIGFKLLLLVLVSSALYHEIFSHGVFRMGALYYSGVYTMLKWLGILFFALLLAGTMYISLDRYLGRLTAAPGPGRRDESGI